MADRPRTWTIEARTFGGDRPGANTAYIEPGLDCKVRVVEWDRERVVPIIEQAIREKREADWKVWSAGDELSSRGSLAEAVFDALNGGGGT